MADDEDDKNRLNPIPKGGKKVFSKPVKIGFLDVEEGKFKKKFRNKFCLLTDARELEWFRRQEDQVERKVEGSVKDMHLCKVDEVAKEYLGSDCCFSVKVHGKSYIFGAANNQERINWMVEILKLRSIQDIIDLLNDPRLSRHAAYALCNQAGNKKGDIQTDIVTLGGVDGLISIVNECLEEDVDAQSDDLLKSIYYAIQKLAENPKNKKRIGKHMVHFLDVLVNEQKPDHWRGFAAQCVLKCLGNDTNIKLLKSVDGITRIAKVFQGNAKDQLLKDVGSTLMLLAEEDDNRLQIARQLNTLVEVLATTSDVGIILLVDLFMKLVLSMSVLDDVLRQPQLVPTLVNHLVSPNKGVQESSSKMVLFLSTSEVKKPAIQEGNGFINLISCSCSESLEAAETALKALESFLSFEENQDALGQLETVDITKLISVLSKEEETILSVGVSIFLIQSRNERAKRAMAAREEKLTQSLLEGLFCATKSALPIAERAFIALANFCTLGLPQLQLVRHKILSKIIESFMTGEIAAENNRSVVRIISYCSSIPMVVKEMGRCVKSLCRLFGEVAIPDIQERCASAIADFSLSESIADLVGEIDGVSTLTRMVTSSRDDQLTVQILRAVANVCYEPKYEGLSNPHLRIYANLTLPSHPLIIRREAARTLKNCTVTRRSELGQLDLAQFNSVLQDEDLDVKASVAFVIANVFGAAVGNLVPRNVCENIQPQLLSSLLNCVKLGGGKGKENGNFDTVVENALTALTCVIGVGLDAIVKALGIEICVDLLDSPNTFISEQSALILENILAAGISPPNLYANRTWNQFLAAFESPSAKTLERLCVTLQHCAQQASVPDHQLQVNNALKKLHPLLHFPLPGVRKSMAEAMIISAKDPKDGSILLKDVGGVVSLMSMSLEGVQIGQNGEWRIELEGAGGFRLVPKTVGTLMKFQFENPDLAKENLALSLTKAFYGATDSKIPSSPSHASYSSFLMDVDEQEQDSNEHKRLGSSTSFSIGGARDPRGASKRARAGLSATPRNISNLVPGRPRGSPSKGDTVGQQHHLVALAEYLSVCDQRIGRRKRSVLSYLRAFRPKSRPPLAFRYGEGTEVPMRIEVDPAQENVHVEPPGLVQSSFQPVGPSALYRTGLVKADKPLPVSLVHSSPLSYFEVCILGKCSPGVGTVGIGLCQADAPRDRQVGWFPNSFAYHSDDGNKFVGGENDAFGPQFGCYDVIGCGVDLISGDVFYTKNGVYIGVAFELPSSAFTPEGALYPCVALSGPNQKVLVNLGQLPFLFDFNFSAMLDFTPVPKSVPGGKVPDPQEDIQKEHPYLKTFDFLSRGWSFTSTSITKSLQQFSIDIFHPQQSPQQSPQQQHFTQHSPQQQHSPHLHSPQVHSPQVHSPQVHHPQQPIPRPMAPLPPAFPSPTPNSFIGSARDGGSSDTLVGLPASSSSPLSTSSPDQQKVMWGARQSSGHMPRSRIQSGRK